MQEAEIRHARLAMLRRLTDLLSGLMFTSLRSPFSGLFALFALAVVGWPMSEVVGPKFLLQEHGLAPSVLNGVNVVTFAAIAASLVGFCFLEYKTALRRTSDTELGKLHREDMSLVWEYRVAGDYNFDPLNLYSSLGDDARGRKGMRELEIVQGRLAIPKVLPTLRFGNPSRAVPSLRTILSFTRTLSFRWLLSDGVWSQIYKISDLTKYPIKVEYTSDGEVTLNKLKESFGNTPADSMESMPSIPQPTTKQIAMAKDAATGAMLTVNGAVKAIKDWTEKNQY